MPESGTLTSDFLRLGVRLKAWGWVHSSVGITHHEPLTLDTKAMWQATATTTVCVYNDCILEPGLPMFHPGSDAKLGGSAIAR